MAKQLIQRNNLSEQLCDIIKESLKSGEYHDGEKLPSENEMVKTYGVSRLTVRAAIARLNALGYVETRAGEGTFFKAFDRNKYLQEVSSILVEPQMLDDINEFRRLMDIECIRLAILRASDEELLKLKDTCVAYENSLVTLADITEESAQLLAEYDYIFHLTICDLSKNSLYSLAYRAAQEALKQYMSTIIASRWLHNKINGKEALFLFSEGHFKLYQAIKDRDFPMAADLIQSHIDYTVQTPEDTLLLTKEIRTIRTNL